MLRGPVLIQCEESNLCWEVRAASDQSGRNCKFKIMCVGGSPGLVVMGRDSRTEGHGFDSWYRILDGHFFTYICCKNCIVCLKRPKINEKEAVVGPFLTDEKVRVQIRRHSNSFNASKSSRNVWAFVLLQNQWTIL